MGFMFSPHRKAEAEERLQTIMSETKRQTGTRRAICHGAGGLRFRDERTRHRSRLVARRSGADAGRILYAGSAGAHPHGIAPAFARTARRARSLHRRVPRRCRVRGHGAKPVRPPAAARPNDQGRRRREARGRFWRRTASTAPSTNRSARDLRNGRIGLAQNRMPASSRMEDVAPGDLLDADATLAGALSPHRHGRA